MGIYCLYCKHLLSFWHLKDKKKKGKNASVAYEHVFNNSWIQALLENQCPEITVNRKPEICKKYIIKHF